MSNINWRFGFGLIFVFGVPLLLISASESTRGNRLPGGKGDNLKPSDVDPGELQKGLRVELEHTGDEDIAQEIALDHLAEDPHYYTKLAKIHVEKNPKKARKKS